MTEKQYFTGNNFTILSEALGLDVIELLDKAEIDTQGIDLQEITLSAKECASFYGTLASHYDGDDIHIKAAKAFAGNPKAVSEMGFLTSSTVDEALFRFAKIQSWIKPINWLVNKTPHSIDLSISSQHEYFPANELVEITNFIYLVESCRLHTGKDIKAKRIVISSEVAYQEKIANELGCEIEVSNFNLLSLEKAISDLPLTHNHSFLGKYIDQEHDDRTSKITDSSTSFIERVSYVIKENLLNGITSEDVAKSLNMSKRTFERRLSEHQLSYRKIIDKVRADMSIDYLFRKNYGVTEISYMLGYKEPNSFLRAFKRWHGTSPGEYVASP